MLGTSPTMAWEARVSPTVSGPATTSPVCIPIRTASWTPQVDARWVFTRARAATIPKPACTARWGASS